MYPAYLLSGYVFVRALAAAYVIFASGLKQPAKLTEVDDSAPAAAVTAIIVTHNDSDSIDRQLDALLASNGVGLDVVVVDNCSSDNTFKTIQKYIKDYPQAKIELLVKRKYSSFKRACVSGFNRREHAEFVLFLDGETEVEPETALNLVESVKSSNQQQLVTARATSKLNSLEPAVVFSWLTSTADQLTARSVELLPARIRLQSLVKSGQMYRTADFNLIKNMPEFAPAITYQKKLSTKAQPRKFSLQLLSGGLRRARPHSDQTVFSWKVFSRWALLGLDIAAIAYAAVLLNEGVTVPFIALLSVLVGWTVFIVLSGDATRRVKLGLIYGMPLLAFSYSVSRVQSAFTQLAALVRLEQR